MAGMDRASHEQTRKILHVDYPGLMVECDNDLDLALRALALRRLVRTEFNEDIARARLERAVERLREDVDRLCFKIAGLGLLLFVTMVTLALAVIALSGGR